MSRIVKSSPESFAEAVKILRAGGLVALPTETVYGLAADARNDEAVAKIFKAKGRPSHNPLIVHIFDPADLGKWAEANEMAKSLAKVFWPGPLTLVLPKVTDELSAIAGANLSTLAIRCPENKWSKAFKELGFNGPIVMPSANRSGHISPTRAQHVADDLGDQVDLIIDGGECDNGIESTILKIEKDRAVLLRPGVIPVEDFVPYISDLRLPEKAAQTSAPGMLKSHYAPKARVRLNAMERRSGEAYLAFGHTEVIADMNLSASADLAEAARNLYAALRSLDKVEVIAVAPIPPHGMGAAINDRLRRAAADRD
ncbi:MAG: threonylcarbamoyl-AMP synthase [Hellea sp.]|nr:threonylcarbamoyl-AMP synthase [Hellea sp.]